MVWMSSVVASASHALAGNVDLYVAVPLLLGGTLGVQGGVNLCDRLGDLKLRRYFVLVVLATIVLVGGKIVQIVF
jgi:uncharacterized membrane protein YfcA